MTSLFTRLLARICGRAPSPPRATEVPPDGGTRFWLNSMEVDEDLYRDVRAMTHD